MIQMSNKVYIVYHTDMHTSYSSFRTIGVASNYVKAVEMAQQDKDAVSDVNTENGHIVIYQHVLDVKDSDKQIFHTNSTSDKNILNLEF